MDPIQARLIRSIGTRAEVVVYFGEGSQKRSVTRHLKGVYGGRGVGRNPDEAAIARLDKIEAIEALAQKRYDELAPLAEIEPEELNIYFRRIKIFRSKAAGVPAELLAFVLYMGDAILKAKVEILKAAIDEAVTRAKIFSEAAHKDAEEMRAEVPRIVEFVF